MPMGGSGGARGMLHAKGSRAKQRTLIAAARSSRVKRAKLSDFFREWWGPHEGVNPQDLPHRRIAVHGAQRAQEAALERAVVQPRRADDLRDRDGFVRRGHVAVP